MYLYVCSSGQGEAVSLNVSSGLSTSYDLQGKELDEGDYTGEGYELTEGEQGEGFSQEEEEYGVDKYGHEEDMEYTTTQNDEGYEDEVLDLQINEPLDDEFQGVGPEEEGEEPEVEIEVEQEADTKEESDEDEEDNEESGRQRFKTERKDVTVVRLSDAASKRRNIPETLGSFHHINLPKLATLLSNPGIVHACNIQMCFPGFDVKGSIYFCFNIIR
uniref:Uncharacterized protein n=1 Tax=Electrophorus electricus TaxID=8005 RepID=A0A4W4F422_ELEEL